MYGTGEYVEAGDYGLFGCMVVSQITHCSVVMTFRSA